MMEGQPHDWGYDRRQFQEWLCRRFQIEGAAALGDTSIVSSFWLDQTTAFQNYFAFLEDFLALENVCRQTLDTREQKKGFIDLVKAIRKQPAMYLGHATFQGCCSFLMGDERAYRDLNLPREDDRQLFHDFTQWIEATKNRASIWRPWFKVIEFWSGGIDCGHTRHGAFMLFFKWLDEYAGLIGKEGLFS